MNRYLVAASAVLLAAPSAPAQHGVYFTGLPPERFRTDSVGIVVYVTDVAKACDQKPGEVLYACAKEIDGTKVMFLPNPCALGEVEWFARIACHEAGHNLGWSREHEL